MSALLITGATGHLGQAVVREALARGHSVRALVTPGDRYAEKLPAEVTQISGDVTDAGSLDALFDAPGDIRVLHCAGIVTIATRRDGRLWPVNVQGTRNMLRAAHRRGAARFVYVGSVHAIPENASGAPMSEPARFDPALVVGQYAKSKAEAAQSVLDAAGRGLNASVALPSGLLGPYDYRGGHMARLFRAVTRGNLRAVVRGGYDFADVRDVAAGLLQCLDKGRPAESYILSGGWHSILDMARGYCLGAGKRPVRLALPLPVARFAAPFAEALAALRGVPALFTGYSLRTVTAPANFSRAKAERELGYAVRPMADTLRDMAAFDAGLSIGGRAAERVRS